MPAILRLEQLLGCKLCWHITFAVFALLLIVESALLIPSALRFQRVELERLADHAVIAIEPALLVSGAAGAASTAGLAALAGQYRIAGLALFGRDGAVLLRSGEHEALTFTNAVAGTAGMMATQLARSPDGRRTDIAWRSSGADGALVLARLDSSHLEADLRAYLLRIGGLILVIVVVVTAGTMLVVHAGVLRPLLALRASSLAAAAAPDAAEGFQLRSSRRDEMGQVLRAHDEMLQRVAQARRNDREFAEQRARHLSHHDPLTGLPNRAALMDYLERCRAAGGDGRRAVLCLVNLRAFGRFNAAAGVRRGDALLLSLAEGLKAAAGAADFVCHLGSDRFAVVHLRDAGGSDAVLAERLLRAAAEGCAGAAGKEAPRVRLGVSAGPLGTLDGPELLAQAEFALSRTGAESTLEYQFFSAERAAEASERQALARDLEAALAAGELFLAYQPKLDLAARAGAPVAAAEALLRWTHASRGAVSPGLFVPLAESTGLIVPLGDHVLNASCAQMRAWLDRHGWSPRVAVNLSALQFALPDLEERLLAALGAWRLPPGLLELEVTETAAMHDVAHTSAVLGRLRALGMKVSIDDFGSGYSSLLYLHRFAPDAIKIDRSFVESIGSDRQGEAICDAVLRLGQSLGARVVAEGVETEAQLEFLRRRRCDEAQGYLIGRPVPAAEYESRWIAARAAA